MQNKVQDKEGISWGALSFCRPDAYPDLYMSPLAEPLLSRFGGGEFRHFFPVELEDTRVFMPHDLQETFQWLILSISEED